jgi:hypothetical protein
MPRISFKTCFALAFMNLSFSAILVISHIRLVQVSDVQFSQGFHETCAYHIYARLRDFLRSFLKTPQNLAKSFGLARSGACRRKG